MKWNIGLFSIALLALFSCRENDTEPLSHLEPVERTLTFGAEIEQLVEPMSTKAADDASILNLLVFLFDREGILVDIIEGPVGKSVTKTVKCIPNQLYTIVYLANVYGSIRANTQIIKGTTRITDYFLIIVPSSGVVGGDLIAYGQEKRILTIEDPTQPIVAMLTPKVARLKLKLPATENTKDMRYTLWCQYKLMEEISFDGKNVKYINGFTSIENQFLLTKTGEYILYIKPMNPTDKSILSNITRQNIISGTTQKKDVYFKVGFIAGKSYIINLNFDK